VSRALADHGAPPWRSWLNDINSNDVDRALAAFGAQPMKYRSFEKHRLPAAAHAASAVLDDMAFDPFAPQPVMHALDERLPDVLLPITSLVEVTAANGETTGLSPRVCAVPPARREVDRELHAESPEAAIATPPEPARVDAVRSMPAPTPVLPAILSPFAKPAPPMPTQAAARPVAGLSLPTLGAKFGSVSV